MSKELQWWEKELAFEKAWNAGRVNRDPFNIYSYIPENKLEFVADVGVDLDGYWIYLEPDCVAYDGDPSDCGIIHEYRVSDLKKAIKTIRRKGTPFVY